MRLLQSAIHLLLLAVTLLLCASYSEGLPTPVSTFSVDRDTATDATSSAGTESLKARRRG